jgi:hypothetical protein
MQNITINEGWQNLWNNIIILLYKAIAGLIGTKTGKGHDDDDMGVIFTETDYTSKNCFSL